MSTFNELQSLWQQAPPPVHPAPVEIKRLVRKSRRKIMGKAILSTLLLLACVGVQIGVLVNFHPVYVTTRIGLLLMMLAATIGIINNMQQLYLLQASATATDAATGLAFTLRYQEKMKRYFTIGVSLVFSILSVGLLLYLYEFAHNSILFIVCSYGATFIYIAICWLVLKRRLVKKHTKSIDTMITRLRQLQDDWKD